MSKLWKIGICIVSLLLLAGAFLRLTTNIFDHNLVDNVVIRQMRMAALDANKQRWSEHTPQHYRYSLSQGSLAVALHENVLEKVSIEVRNGAIVSLLDDKENQVKQSVKEYALIYPGSSVEKLFTLIQNAIERNADRVDVSYDVEFGYPTHILIVYNERTFDDWIGFSIENFEVLPSE